MTIKPALKIAFHEKLARKSFIYFFEKRFEPRRKKLIEKTKPGEPHPKN